MTTRIRIALAVAMAGVTLILACGDPKSRTPAGPSPFEAVSITNIDINGPASVAPGQSAQFTVNTRLADGTAKLVVNAPNLRWRTSNGLLQVSVSGVATAGQQSGETILTAELTVSGGVRRSTREVVIVPDGTYRMVGRVTEADPLEAPLPGARIVVTPGTSLTATTDSNGQYRLYGVPAQADVRVTADGYVPSTQGLQLTGHTTRNFQLALAGPRLNLSGNYRLVIDVVGACSGTPPLTSDLQHRAYDAVLTQNGSVVDVTLIEPRFRISSTGLGNRFSGRTDAAGARFTLLFYNWYYYYSPPDPNVAERLQDGTILTVEGTATTSGSAAGLSGPMEGRIALWDSTFPTNSQYLGTCTGPLRFTLTPR